MTDEQQETIVNEVLRKFCYYLNQWWNHEPFNKDEKDPYKPEKFTSGDGETDWEVLEESLIKITTTDGDEGGGNVLYVGLQDEELEISWIVQVFDTPVMIYTKNEGYPNLP